MNKLFYFLITTIILSSCTYKNENNSSENNSTIVETSAAKDTIIDATPFLKNTTYTYTGEYPSDRPLLIDTSYTPYAKYKLEFITVKLKLNEKTAIATTNKSISHRIESIKYERDAKYYQDENGRISFDNNFKAPSRAVLTTNKGKITITEPKPDSYSSKQYELLIEYGNYFAGNKMTLTFKGIY